MHGLSRFLSFHEFMNHAETMKTIPMKEELSNSLNHILASIPWIKDHFSIRNQKNHRGKGYDLLASIPQKGGEPINLVVECKNQPRPSLFQYMHEQLKSHATDIANTYLVLAAPHISPRIAELCKDSGMGWYDAGGNCYFSFAGLHIERSGKRSKTKTPRPKANLSTDASARVLRTIFTEKFLKEPWTQTELQKGCQPQTSIGLVNKVTHYLLEQGWLTTGEGGRFKLKNGRGLLTEWAKIYRFNHNRRRNFYTLLSPDELQQQLAPLCDDGEQNGQRNRAAYAAFSAADWHAPHVIQNKTWLYLNQETLDNFIKLTSAKEVQGGENIVVLIPPDEGVYIDRKHRQGLDLPYVSKIQTWLDLLHVGSRGEEAAEAVMNRCIAPQLKTFIDE